jgi:ATP-dependent Lon protease
MVEQIPGPLRDRLEMIDFCGYTEREKLAIARRHLIPRQMAANSLEGRGITFADEAVQSIIGGYTQEAGVRNLERELATVCRKLARLYLKQPEDSAIIAIDAPMVATFLGPRKYDHETAAAGHPPGVATGLVWSEFGGEIIFVEAGIMKGTQQLILTGSLGKILQESAQTALSYVRGHTDRFGIAPDFFNGHDIHIHIPAGGVAKDGPSAGITIVLALISLLSGRCCRPDAAMTGEVSLSGRILPVRGLREKLLAAQRAGIKKVMIPRGNAVDIAHLGLEITAQLELILADDAAAAAEHVLLPAPGFAEKIAT